MESKSLLREEEMVKNYCAHILVSTRWKEPLPGDKLHLYENLVWISCKGSDDPWVVANEYAKNSYSASDDTATLNGRPCYDKFEGVRKIVEFCVNEVEREITYLELEIEDELALAALLARESVSIICYDDLLPEDRDIE